MRFLFVDQILELIPSKYIKGIKHVTPDDYYLTKDYSGKLCFIPSFVGETLGQLAAWNVMFSNDFTLRPVAGIASSAILLRPPHIGETVLLESFIDSLDETVVQYHSLASVDGEEIFSIKGALGPLLPMNEFIDPDLVKQQFSEIYRPGSYSFSSNSSSYHPLYETSGPIISKLTYDAIIASNPGVSIVAEKKISRAAPYFPDHFPNKPVLPMTVLLECKINLAFEFIKIANFPGNYKVQGMRKIKMKDFIQPGDVITSYLSVKDRQENQLNFMIQTEVRGQKVCVLEIILTKVN